MNPEDRADVMVKIVDSERFNEGFRERLTEWFEMQIREAENRAYERAADAAARSFISTRVSLDTISDCVGAIRALKHPEQG